MDIDVLMFRLKKIETIKYNHLNLPVSIHFLDDKQIKYIYDATGTKLQKQIYVNNTLTSIKSYAGAFIYEKSSLGGSEELQCFCHAEGYVEKVDQVYYQYFYQYKDHPGNVRLNYAKGPDSLMIKEENNYYPFGVKHKGYNNTITGRDHKYGYGNKEEQDELGLEWMDFHARNYDAVLGRWMNIDPLSENFFTFSPYNYVLNNPLYFIDSDGQEVINYDEILLGLEQVEKLINDNRINKYRKDSTNSELSDEERAFALRGLEWRLEKGQEINDNI